MDPQPPTGREAPRPEAIVGLADMTAAVTRVIGSARNELAILSCRLEPALYGDAALVDALHELALRHERVRVRILVNDPEPAGRRAHRLVEFARRLTSRIEIRQLAEDHRGTIDDCVIADTASVWMRERPDSIESRLFMAVPLEARAQLRRFDPLWEFATPARELMSLHI